MSKKENNIDSRKNDIEEKTDCFAYKSKDYCNALVEKQCKFCPFYKSDKEKKEVVIDNTIIYAN